MVDDASLFTLHSRLWESNRFVYPVISRRSRGLSIGINLNPDKICNFDCVYCSVDRSRMPGKIEVDLDLIQSELSYLLNIVQNGQIWNHAPFNRTPESLQRLNDIAFSGDGEPTSYPRFQNACEQVAGMLQAARLPDVKIVLITNATLLHQPRIERALAFLDLHNGEIWAKLDAGTEAYYRTIERTTIPLARVMDNILHAGQVRSIVIQSLFMRLHDQSTPSAEIDAYLERLETLRSGGCRIKLVQIYTVARSTAELFVTPLSHEEVDAIALRVREAGFNAAAYYDPG